MGSGKTSVAEILRRSGYCVADADALAHECLRPGTSSFDQIVEKFGSEILDTKGSIDRRKLGLKVFSDGKARLWLEQLIHPFVQERVRELQTSWKQQGIPFAFYDVPLLFEKNMEAQFDGVIVVTCSKENQKQRLKLRNSWTDAEIQQRLEALLPMEVKNQKATYLIHNDGSHQDLEKAVHALLQQLQALPLES